MAISPRCDACKTELTEFGAILLSPPVDDTVRKYHICTACFEKIRGEYLTHQAPLLKRITDRLGFHKPAAPSDKKED